MAHMFGPGTSLKRRLFRTTLRQGDKKKSAEIRSEEYGECWTITLRESQFADERCRGQDSTVQSVAEYVGSLSATVSQLPTLFTL
ncbi:hypothetical protein AVEN_83216-1 [Araneus ventricosus]|uniref:Uncharacterized protein n=1 Tax=Araneus ventricosus TaxID=182803 RepID=A0A4Y2KLK3_ARAVE|nr:hypothetical protein AVEN_83216-1 [Araneus ventricosus]